MKTVTRLAVVFALFLSGLSVGVALVTRVPMLHMVVNDQGHALFGVADTKVQATVVHVVGQYTGLRPFMVIESGGTHQIVLSDASTVIATMNDPALPQAARMFIVNDPKQRAAAAQALANSLTNLGYADTKIIEPDPRLPEGTMLLVVSPHALTGGGIGFRPNGRIMGSVAPKDEAKFL